MFWSFGKMDKIECCKCNEREGVINYSDSMLDYTHGFVIQVCRQCYIKEMQKMIEDCRKGIKEQKALIRKDKFMSEKNG